MHGVYNGSRYKVVLVSWIAAEKQKPNLVGWAKCLN